MPKIRITIQTQASLGRIARETGETVQAALARAVEDRLRRVYLEGLASDYAALRKNPPAWKDHCRETQLWERTIADGI